MTTTTASKSCRWGVNALGHETLICSCGTDTCTKLREITCSFCGEHTDALPGLMGTCCHCKAAIYGGTDERYWCDTCQDWFYGADAIVHKGARCYAEDQGA